MGLLMLTAQGVIEVVSDGSVHLPWQEAVFDVKIDSLDNVQNIARGCHPLIPHIN